MLNILPPSALQGTEQAQLQQVYRYLFKLSEELNVALGETDNRISNIQVTAPSGTGIGGGAGGIDEEQLEATLAEQYNSLKALIVKTADTVRAEMDVIVTELESKYVAQSEWGEYKEDVSLEIQQTAKETVESYKYSEQIEGIQEDVADFEAYKIETEGFIRRGIIGYDDKNFPIIGIAIGQNLRSTTINVGGVLYEEFDTTANMATYAADKLSFWINGVEVAYLSNSELDVTRIKVTDSIQLGNWDIKVNAADGMTIQKRIGNELDLSENNTITITADQINAIADDIDLSGNRSITLTSEQIDLIAEQIDLSANDSIILAVGSAANLANAAQNAADAAQGTANAAQDTANSANSAAQAAQNAATAAQNAANSASSTASTAQNVANDAHDVANDAGKQAQTATSAAYAAQLAAQDAQSAANLAQGTANTAQSAANAAQGTANTANSAAQTAQNTANAAQTAAGNAQNTADAAQNTANAAQSSATNAQNTANAAQSAANAAQNTADAAKNAADAAQNTADSANAAAGDAQETATNAGTLAQEAVKSIGDIPNYVEIAEDGVYIKDLQKVSTLKLNSGSVSIGAVTGEESDGGFSQLTADYVQFGNYQMRKSDTDGGLIFKLAGG